MADASAAKPAQCAFSLKPPSNTNSTTSGIAAKIELTPSDPLTGSYTCLNMMSSPCPWSFLPRGRALQTGPAGACGGEGRSRKRDEREGPEVKRHERRRPAERI